MSDTRNIVLNTAIQAVGKVATSLLTLGATLLIIRAVGTGVYGDLAKVTVLLAIGYSTLDFGINALVVRELEGKKPQEKKLLLANTLFLRLIMAIGIIALISIVVFLLPLGQTSGYTQEVKTAFFLGAISIILLGIHTSTNALFQHLTRYDKVVIPAISGAAIMLALTYRALQTNASVINLVTPIIAGYATTATVSLFYARSWIITQVSFQQALRLGKRAIPIGAVLVLSILANKTDIVILGVLRPSQEVGEYNFAYKIFDFVLVFPVLAMNAVYPILLRKRNKQRLANKTAKILLGIGVVATAVTIVGSPLIALIRPDLTTSISTLRILALSLPLFYVTAPIMWQLIAQRRELMLIKVYALASVLNIGGNLALVPSQGATASAVLTILTEASILIGLYYVRKKRN